MKVGSLVRFEKWYGIITATKGNRLEEGEVMVLWRGMPIPSWHPTYCLELISEGR